MPSPGHNQLVWSAAARRRFGCGAWAPHYGRTYRYSATAKAVPGHRTPKNAERNTVARPNQLVWSAAARRRFGCGAWAPHYGRTYRYSATANAVPRHRTPKKSAERNTVARPNQLVWSAAARRRFGCGAWAPHYGRTYRYSATANAVPGHRTPKNAERNTVAQPNQLVWSAAARRRFGCGAWAPHYGRTYRYSATANAVPGHRTPKNAERNIVAQPNQLVWSAAARRRFGCGAWAPHYGRTYRYSATAKAVPRAPHSKKSAERNTVAQPNQLVWSAAARRRFGCGAWAPHYGRTYRYSATAKAVPGPPGTALQKKARSVIPSPGHNQRVWSAARRRTSAEPTDLSRLRCIRTGREACGMRNGRPLMRKSG